MAETEMTIRQALAAAMSPYALPKQSVEFLLIQQGLDGDATYDNSMERTLFMAVIEGLYKVITLEKEKDPGTENAYDTDKIEDLIRHYQRKYDIEEPEDYQFINRTDEW